MKRNTILGCVMASTLLLASTGCRPMEAPVEEASPVDTARAAVVVDKPLPNFPLRYRGAGRFRHVDIPSFQLVARYTFDMEKGVNREQATYIDHEVEIFNVYDMDPSDGVDPDREYFVERDQQTGELHCTLNQPPLPNVFSRDWWLSNDMVYAGTETVSGFEADCWTGAVPGVGFPVKLCSRADKYPELSLLLKQLGPFEFSDHFGVALDDSNDPPPSYFKLPNICKNL
ncbi:MAG: hypothetical protein ACMG6S_07970 [Byssovorax sp.]